MTTIDINNAKELGEALNKIYSEKYKHAYGAKTESEKAIKSDHYPKKLTLDPQKKTYQVKEFIANTKDYEDIPEITDTEEPEVSEPIVETTDTETTDERVEVSEPLVDTEKPVETTDTEVSEVQEPEVSEPIVETEKPVETPKVSDTIEDARVEEPTDNKYHNIKIIWICLTLLFVMGVFTVVLLEANGN